METKGKAKRRSRRWAYFGAAVVLVIATISERLLSFQGGPIPGAEPWPTNYLSTWLAERCDPEQPNQCAGPSRCANGRACRTGPRGAFCGCKSWNEDAYRAANRACDLDDDAEGCLYVGLLRRTMASGIVKQPRRGEDGGAFWWCFEEDDAGTQTPRECPPAENEGARECVSDGGVP